ncbi:MAG: filamentous hemagglutinin N-terminal domain-containing protein [Phycisphaeraceae bacterium]|nr:filamentous hemagglutinin N-terminal domain-containing protein [Phycisphaeraceae bacterium]
MLKPWSIHPRLAGRVIGLGLGRYVFAGAGVVGLISGPVLAGPENPSVVHGTAAFVQNGANTTITASHNAIINYSSFNIGAAESVRFIQPGATSRVLNRIDSAMPTRIDGSLSANGSVYFVNRAGVMFGNGAVVNVGGLYAAAANLSNQNFLAGINHFTDVSGSVVNSGMITASSVNLIGRYVANHGTVLADTGVVTMTAGDDVYLGEFDGRIIVKVEGGAVAAAATPASPQAGVTNSGRIQARSGRVTMAAGDMYSLAISNSGSVAARDITLQGGQGRGAIVEVGGTLDASTRTAGETGGSVRVLGDRVSINHASIDASGAAGGGEVLIGGDFQGRYGKNGDVPNAKRTFVSTDSTISADATQQGDGGKVIVWADEVTKFGGTVSAKGAQGGDGGFAEVSGKQNLVFAGRADLRGSGDGKTGTLLLDPRDITVAPGGGATLDDVDQFGDTPSSDVTIAAATINSAAANVVLQANQDILVTEAIAMSGSGLSLTMQAGRSINVGANISTNDGAVSLTANETAAAGVVDADRGAGAATITFAPGASINAGTGNISLSILDGAGLTNSTSGNLSVGSLITTGDVVIRNLGTTSFSSIVRSEDSSIITAGSAAFEIAGNGGVGVEPRPMRLDVTDVSGVTHAGGIWLSSLQDFTVGNALLGSPTGITTSGGSIGVSSLGAITLAQSVGSTTFAPLIRVRAQGVAVDAPVTNVGGTIQIAADRNADGSGVLTTSVPGTITSGGGDITATAGDMTIAAAIDAGAGSLSLGRASAGTIGLGDATGDLAISGAELDLITAANLIVGNNLATQITVDNILASESDGIAGTTTLNALASNATVQFQGGSSTFRSLSAVANGGITANAGVATTAGAMVLNADANSDGSGSLVVAPTVPLSTSNSQLFVNASDLDLQGTLNSGTGQTVVSSTAAPGIALGNASVSGAMSITGAELSRITADSLELGRVNLGGNIVADGVTSANLSNIAGTVTLLAGGNGSSITFSGGASSFPTLVANADNGITVSADLSTTVGDLSLDADSDGGADSGDALTIGADRTITSAGAMTLSALTGGIQAQGALTLNSASGTRLLSSLNASSGAVGINTDTDADGTGGLTVAAGTTVTTGAALNIVTADLSLDGNITAGANAVTIRSSSPNKSIGLGDATGDMTITTDELSRISAGSLSLGGANTNRIDVDNVTQEASSGVTGFVTLTSGADGGTVRFLNNASTFNSLAVNADDSIDIETNLTTLSAGLTLNADTDSSPDASDAIRLAAVTVSAAGDILMTAPTGGLRLTGANESNTTILAVNGGSITLLPVTADNTSANLSVAAQGNLALGSVNIGTGAFSAIADSDSNTQGATLTVGSMTAGNVTLGAGTDGNDTISITSTLAPSGDLTIQNAGVVDIADGVNLTPGGSLTAASGVNSIVLAGAAGTTHTFSSGNDGVIALGTVSSSNAAGLVLNSEGRINTGAINLGTGSLTVTVDSDNDGSETANIGAVTASSLSATGTGGNDTVSFDSTVNVSGEGGVVADAGAVILGGNVTSPAGPISLTGSIVLAGDLTVSTLGSNRNISFFGPLNGTHNLTVNPGNGTVLFAGAVGGVTPLSGLSIPVADGVTFDSTVAVGNQSLSVSASDIRLGGNASSNGGDVSFAGPLSLTADAVISGNNVAFTSSVNSAGSVARSLIVNSANGGVTTFGGTVGGVGPLASLFTNADGSTRIGGDITTTSGSITINDAAVLTADAAIRALGGGSITFSGTINSDSSSSPRNLTLLVDTSVVGFNIPTINFGGAVGATAALNDLYLNYDPVRGVDGRSLPAEVASITFRQRNADGSPLSISDSTFLPAFAASIVVSRDFIMGLNEKLSALGNLTIASGRNANIGDLAALGNMSVSSPAILVRNRVPGALFASNGQLIADSGIDYVAGGNVTFSVVPTIENAALPNPVFATSSGTGSTNSNLNNFTFRQFGTVSAGVMDLAGVTLDLRAQGPSNTNIATVIAGSDPSPITSGLYVPDATPYGELVSSLGPLGLVVRGMTAEEVVQSLVGRALYNDVPSMVNARTTQLTANRLSPEQVRAVSDAYRQIFPQGDEDPTARAARAAQIRASLADAYIRYQQSGAPARFDAVRFRSFVDSTPQTADASRTIANLETLFGALSALSLSSGEQSVARTAVLRDLTPDGLTTVQLEEVVLARPDTAGV